MTSKRDQIIKDVKNYKRKSATKHLPGFPVSHFLMDEMVTVREMITDGTLVAIDVHKPEKGMTYTYVRVS